MQKQEIIKLESIEKDYSIGNTIVKALAGINLSIKKGEFIAIIGPSGSGKSTIMNMIGALDIPTKGRIFLDNKNIAHLTESELAQIRGRKIGFVFQNFNLIPTLTAKENVALPMLFQGKNKKERLKKSEEILEIVGLSERAEHLPNELSGGERQRVAIARALANNPELILADEPTGNLDSKTGKEIINLFLKLNKKGKTIILVTHNQEIASQAHKILKMKDGRIENAKTRKK